MRYLGIDFGSKRVGVAVSDESNAFAFPLVVLQNSGNGVDELVAEIKKICAENSVGEIVVGESRDFSQAENDIMKQVTPFVVRLQSELGLSVHLHPEFLTSAEAEQVQGKNDMLDASAAAIILKSFLDLRHNTNT